jgi:phage-related protein
MTTVGPGVAEIRVQAGGEFRVLYVATSPNAVYVLHAFQKKTQQTRQREIDLARRRLADLRRELGR